MAPVGRASRRVARRRSGIAAIYQQPALFADLTVAENIALGAGAQRPVGTRGLGARGSAAPSELLARVGARIDPEADAGA